MRETVKVFDLKRPFETGQPVNVDDADPLEQLVRRGHRIAGSAAPRRTPRSLARVWSSRPPVAIGSRRAYLSRVRPRSGAACRRQSSKGHDPVCDAFPRYPRRARTAHQRRGILSHRGRLYRTRRADRRRKNFALAVGRGAAHRERGRAVRRAVLAAARRQCAAVARHLSCRRAAPADSRHRRALAARPQDRRGIPHPARLGRNRRIPAEPDPGDDRTRDAVPPAARSAGAGIPAAREDPQGRRHRLFRLAAEPQLSPLPGGDLGDRPARAVSAMPTSPRSKTSNRLWRRSPRRARSAGSAPICSTPISGRRPAGASSPGRSCAPRASACARSS